MLQKNKTIFSDKRIWPLLKRIAPINKFRQLVNTKCLFYYLTDYSYSIIKYFNIHRAFVPTKFYYKIKPRYLFYLCNDVA